MKTQSISKLTMFAIFYSTLAHAQSQTPVVQNADEWMKGRLINSRTGEMIVAKCFEKTDEHCTKFQYFVDDGKGSKTKLSEILSEAKMLEDITLRKAQKNEGEFFKSSKLFYLTSEPDTMISDIDLIGEHGTREQVSYLYKRGAYTSGGLYALQVVGATPLTAFMGSISAAATAGVVATDVALWPIRLVGHQISRMSQPGFVIPHSYRKRYKKALTYSDLIMTANGDLYMGTGQWKRLHDMLEYLSVI